MGGPFQSGHGPVERAGVLNFTGRARANLAGGNLAVKVESLALRGELVPACARSASAPTLTRLRRLQTERRASMMHLSK